MENSIDDLQGKGSCPVSYESLRASVASIVLNFLYFIADNPGFNLQFTSSIMH